MPKATVTLKVMVTLDVPAEYAAKVTRDDLVQMARCAVPDSSEHPDPKTGLGGARNGVQVEVEEVCQFEDDQPVFADVTIEHDTFDRVDVDLEDEGFERAEK